ncbi:hypothetical protein EOM86_06025 [Candidatus Nomurabacteria bacterium]|nr:hypothetical protein [Candidatus Nomurabacteria bacterium]
MNIKIDISNPIDKFHIAEDVVPDLLDHVAFSLADAHVRGIKADAKSKLNQTRQAYLDGLSLKRIGSGKYVVELTGFMPNAIEFGIPSFDMKDGFKKSKKAHEKKDGGWYLTIPFRHANPSALASSTVFSGVMPRDIYQAVSKIPKGKGLGKTDLPPAHRTVQESMTGYTHKAPIYQGLMASVVNNHTTYTTFRRVSDKSDGDSWFHSGLPAYSIAQGALSKINIGMETKRAVDIFLDKIGS